MLNLRVAIRNTLRYKLKISGKSINSAQSLFHSGLIQTLEMAMKVYITTQEFHASLSYSVCLINGNSTTLRYCPNSTILPTKRKFTARVT